MKTLPKGAHSIHQARVCGRKPAELVLISMLGDLQESNPVVVVERGADPRQFDWRWSRGLETLVVFDEQTKLTARVTTRCLLDQKHNGMAQTFLWRADKQFGWVVMEGSDRESHLFRMMAGELRAFGGLGCS